MARFGKEGLTTISAAAAGLATLVTPQISSWWLAGPLWCFSAVAAFRWWQVAQENKDEEQRVRIKYSSEQILEHEFSSKTGPIHDVANINLDNAATLTMGFIGTLDGVDLLLLQSTPITVEQPQGDASYSVGGLSTQFPAAGTPGIDIRGARLFDATGAQEFAFTRDGINRTHVIPVRDRKFQVTLKEIRDRSRPPDHKHIQWVFGISEL
jgi:hypothetical protein